MVRILRRNEYHILRMAMLALGRSARDQLSRTSRAMVAQRIGTTVGEGGGNNESCRATTAWPITPRELGLIMVNLCPRPRQLSHCIWGGIEMHLSPLHRSQRPLMVKLRLLLLLLLVMKLHCALCALIIFTLCPCPVALAMIGFEFNYTSPTRTATILSTATATVTHQRAHGGVVVFRGNFAQSQRFCIRVQRFFVQFAACRV